MALLQLTVEFRQICAALTRIADALDRLAPPPIEVLAGRYKRGPEALIKHVDRRSWREEQVKDVLPSDATDEDRQYAQDVLDKMP